ncbi:hypothetical protein OHA25_60700 (plasmid) [Nonomuraea sp. NBC_00507]|uniref:hypothetical protein n=1 Tax=Nonomuraea sp. NBC_00507 TaxID=2976002 RepID=UPI002E1727F4
MRSNRALLEIALSVAAALLGLNALTQRSSFMWVLYELGLPYPFCSWLAWAPTFTIAGLCFRITVSLWQHGTIPVRTAAAAAVSWLVLLGIDLAWWVR